MKAQEAGEAEAEVPRLALEAELSPSVPFSLSRVVP